PVVLTRLEEDAVARADHLDRPALALAEADTLGDPDGLAVRVGMPSGAGAGGEVDACGADRRRLRRCGHRVDEHRPREPVARPGVRLEVVSGDLHRSPSVVFPARRVAAAVARGSRMTTVAGSALSTTRGANGRIIFRQEVNGR